MTPRDDRMQIEGGERTIMMMKPVRLANLRYYVMMIIALIVAGYLQWFRHPSLPDFSLLNRSIYVFVEILLVLIAFLLVVVAEFKRMMQTYMITNMRVIDTYGIVRKSTTVMMSNQIERVYVTQGILQRLLRYGDVVVDTGEDQIVLTSVKSPTKVEGAITQAMASRYPGK